MHIMSQDCSTTVHHPQMKAEKYALKSHIFIRSVAKIAHTAVPLEATGKQLSQADFLNFLERQRVYYTSPFIK